MNHDYAHCLDYDSAVCPSDCFRAQLVEDLRKRKDMVGIPVSWMKFRQLSECALNIPKPTNYDRIISKTPEELAEWINNEYGSTDWCPVDAPVDPVTKMCLVHDDCIEYIIDWLKQEVKDNG